LLQAPPGFFIKLTSRSPKDSLCLFRKAVDAYTRRWVIMMIIMMILLVMLMMMTMTYIDEEDEDEDNGDEDGECRVEAGNVGEDDNARWTALTEEV
jgi:uncharacterized membrane protein